MRPQICAKLNQCHKEIEVVKEEAETTKNRIVYDASARAGEHSLSFTECLEVGPKLQNQIWDILVRNRFKPIVITGDIKQAFLQVKIRENDRNFLQFHWIKDIYTQEIQVLRFTRALGAIAIPSRGNNQASSSDVQGNSPKVSVRYRERVVC